MVLTCEISHPEAPRGYVLPQLSAWCGRGENCVKRAGSDDALRCSFCHKSQDVVGKLISSPSDYPRAYICDECIAVCNTILEDDKIEPPPGPPNQILRSLEFQQVRRAIEEDIGSGDVTTEACVPESQLAKGRFIAREPLVIAGLDLLPTIY